MTLNFYWNLSAVDIKRTSTYTPIIINVQTHLLYSLINYVTQNLFLVSSFAILWNILYRQFFDNSINLIFTVIGNQVHAVLKFKKWIHVQLKHCSVAPILNRRNWWPNNVVFSMTIATYPFSTCVLLIIFGCIRLVVFRWARGSFIDQYFLARQD